MSIYDISKVSRNKYISDNIKACEQEIELSHELFLNIKNCIMSQTDENRIEEWEEWFGLSNEKSWSLKDRIDRLIYTFNSRGFFTPKFLKDQIKSILNEEVDILEDFPNYHFIIKFRKMLSGEHNLESFKEMLNVNKPAHLTYDIKLRYRTWGELKAYTGKILKIYTWEETRSRAEIKEA